MPEAEILQPDAAEPLVLHGVKVSVELQFRLRRLTKSNKVKVGGGMLRYAKGKALENEIAAWQSSFLFGFLTRSAVGTDEPEQKLCITIDSYSGVAHPAPTDATRRFNNMVSACATIAERWPAIQPPPNALF